MTRSIWLVVALVASTALAAHSSPARLDRLEARSNVSHVLPESNIAPRGLEARALDHTSSDSTIALRGLDGRPLKRRASSRRSKSAKKGLGISSQGDVSAFGGAVSWAYGWSPVPPGGPGKSLGNGVQFVPMLWNQKQSGGFAPNVRAAVKSNVKGLSPYLLEPDLVRVPMWTTAHAIQGSQANLTPQQAAKLWKAQIEPVLRANPGLRAVSPAVTNGGGKMGIAWLRSFLSECKGCHIDAIALHWYAEATNVAYFKSYFTAAQKEPAFKGRPIWITEFEGLGSLAQKEKFLQTVVPWLRSQPKIQRFAAFGLDPSSPFVQNGRLTDIGRVYRDA